jgi:uncharacterized protein (DUF433 family)
VRELCKYIVLFSKIALLIDLALGMSQEEILENFPYLTQADILACFWFAAQRERITVTVQT